MATAAGSPRARTLAAALRRARADAGLSLRALANRLQLHQSYLSRIENGKRIPSIETTARILGTLQSSADDVEQILDMARNAAEPNWVTSHQLPSVIECERAATAIAAWHPCLVPGLLQTADYVRAIAVSYARADGLPDQCVESRVAAKMPRNEILTRRGPVRLKALIWEPVLRLPIGGAVVMSGQLQHLLKMSEQPNVTIQIVPQCTAWHPGSAGPFVLYEFADAAPAVHFEHHVSGAFIQHDDAIAHYRKAVDEIARIALPQDESLKLINGIIDEELRP